MKSFIRFADTLSRIGGVVAILLLLGAVLVVSQMVFVRYVLAGSTIWQTEFVTYSLIAATFIGSPYVLLHKGHVNVDLLQNAASPHGRRVMQFLSGILSIAFCGLLAWSGWEHFHEALSNGWTTDTVWKLPLWIPLLPLPLGIGLLVLQYIAELMKHEGEQQ